MFNEPGTRVPIRAEIWAGITFLRIGNYLGGGTEGIKKSENKDHL